MQGLAVVGAGGDEIGVEIVGCLRVGKLGALADGYEDVVAENVVMDDVLAVFHRPVQCDVIARRCCRQADGAVAFFVFVAAGVVGNIEQAVVNVAAQALEADFAFAIRVLDLEANVDGLDGFVPKDIDMAERQGDGLGGAARFEGDASHFVASSVDEGELAFMPALRVG